MSMDTKLIIPENGKPLPELAVNLLSFYIAIIVAIT